MGCATQWTRTTPASPAPRCTRCSYCCPHRQGLQCRTLTETTSTRHLFLAQRIICKACRRRATQPLRDTTHPLRATPPLRATHPRCKVLYIEGIVVLDIVTCMYSQAPSCRRKRPHLQGLVSLICVKHGFIVSTKSYRIPSVIIA